MLVDISLNCAVTQRPLFGTLVRLPRPLSLMDPYSRRLMIALRLALHGFVSDGLAFGLSFHCHGRCDRILPRPIQAVWNQGPQGKADVRWRCFPGRSA